MPGNHSRRVPQTRRARATPRSARHHGRLEHTHQHTHPTTQPGKENRSAAKTQSQAHTPTPGTPGGMHGVQEEGAHKHTQPNTQARIGRGKGGACTRTDKPGHPSHHWWGESTTVTKTHTPQTPAGKGRGKGRARTQIHTPKNPSQQRQGAAKTRTQAQTPTPHSTARIGVLQAERAHEQTHPYTPARNGGVKAKPEPKHTHRRPQQGMAVSTQNQQTNTCTADLGQEWRGTSGAPTRPHRPQHPSQERRGQPKPKPKHTHQHCTPQRGLAGYRRTVHTDTHTSTSQPGMAR